MCSSPLIHFSWRPAWREARVAAELPGFQEFVYQRVTLGVGAQVRLNFTLSVSAVATTVDVSVETSPLLATSATVGGVIQGQQILDLPLIDQNATSLALTQPQFAGGIGGGLGPLKLLGRQPPFP